MKASHLSLLLPLAIALSGPARAQTAPAATSAIPTIPGWDALVDGLRVLPGQILAQLPPDERNDPQVRQEVGRLVLEGLAQSTLDTIAGDGDHPVFLPASNQVLNIGQPNADTIYRSARISPGGTYRLRGLRGSLSVAMIGQSEPNLGEGGSKPNHVGRLIYDDINALHTDAHGRFDVILSATRPAGYTGDWWQLDPKANKLLLRMVSDDWAHEQDLTISIERLNHAVEAPRPPAAVLEARLRRLPAQVTAITSLLAGHVEKLRHEGYVNKLMGTDFAQLGGLKGQFYYEGDYDLPDGQALIVSAKLPAKCRYYSIILTNEIYETTDWTDNESSLNDTQSVPDADGILRIVVTAKDPGVPNWLDTAGYPLGVIQGRWNGCTTQPIPTIQEVPFADLRHYLPADTPAVTPAQRDGIIRDRRAAYDQRPLW
jgi:hypothetical protein